VVDLLRAAATSPDDGPEAVPAMPWDPPADDAPTALVALAATDPAQPYGAALGWPPSSGQPSRSVGAYVVLVEGEACAYLERGGRRLLTFPAAVEHPDWTEALATLVRDGRARRLSIESVDGDSAATSGWAPALRAAGFAEGYRGLTLGR
jgi:ATP-dependent Lhr-like helicase